MQQTKPTASFFKEQGFRLCLSYFDATRGQKEGQEYDKVLAFYPTTAALTIRTAIVGLAQAFSSFSSSFAERPNSSADNAKFMEAEQNKWAMLECEPDIWLVLVVSKAWATPGCSNEAMRSSLGALHSMFVLLHGPVSKLLEQDPSGFQIRRVLQPFMDEAGSRLAAADMKDPASLLNPMGMQRGLPLMTTPSPVFLGVQCLVNQLLVSSTASSSRLVSGAMACWQGHLLWGSLPLQDMEALTLLACRALGPATGFRAKQSKLEGTKQLLLASTGGFQERPAVVSETLLSPHQWSIVAAAPSSRNHALPLSLPPSYPAVSGGSSSNSLPQHLQSAAAAAGAAVGSSPQAKAPAPTNGFLVPKLRQPGQARPDAVAVQQQQQRWQAPVMQTTRVWLQGLQQQCVLLPYFDGPLLVLLLLHDHVVPTQDVVSPVSEVLVRECPPLVELLSSCLPRKNQWHHKGYRYCIRDEALGSVRASPGKKMLTMSSASLRLVAHISNKLDYWGTAGSTQLSGDSPATSAQPTTRNAAGYSAGQVAPKAEQAQQQGVGSSKPDSASEVQAKPSGAAVEGGGSADIGSSRAVPPRIAVGDSPADTDIQGRAQQSETAVALSEFPISDGCGRLLMACRGFGEGSGWVVARREASRQLLVAMESVPEPSLHGAVSHAQRLCNAAVPGVFS